MAASPHRLPVVALGTCLLAGCFAPPEPTDPSPPARVQRVLASDWSIAGWQARGDAFGRAWAALGPELQRVERLPGRASDLASRVPLRFDAAIGRVGAAVVAELGRAERLRPPAPLLPDPDAWAQQTAATLAALPVWLGLDRRPLGEPSDREHRTDPHDERPAATFWQRVGRRLGLASGR